MRLEAGRNTRNTKNTRRSSRNVDKKGDADSDPNEAIPFPCCPKEKVMVFAEAHGRVSIKCPNCGKYAMFDYDHSSARISGACRGANRKLMAEAHTD